MELWDLVLTGGEDQKVAGEADYSETLAQHRHLLLQRILQAERPLARIWPY